MSILTNSAQVSESAKNFEFLGDIIDIVPFGSGHINDTFCVTTTNTAGISYLLQRINHHIFADVAGLMYNIQLVENHLKRKLPADKQALADQYVLSIIPTKEEKLFFQDADGDYWRMFVLIRNTKSYDIVETPQQAREGGKAFGQFQLNLADLDATKIVEVLPNFHNIDFRLSNLNKAIEKNSEGRLAAVEDIIQFIRARELRMKTILKQAKDGLLPLRITHNDTKFNNVLLDAQDQVQCVIDLDTVMPGHVAYDFGDAIRTIINPAAEDETDLSKVKLNIPLFEAYTAGYLGEAKGFLTAAELDSLLEGVFLLPFMQGVRFLTDYLEGDHYFKVAYSDHNLVRTKTQFKLVSELEAAENELQAIIEKYVK